MIIYATHSSIYNQLSSFLQKKKNISSSTFTVPKGVKKIDVFCVGGGGGGNMSGGGGGYTNTMKNVAVTPGQQLPVVVGSAASTSSVGSICSANGGVHGKSVGNGGSGGGSSTYYDDVDIYLADLTPGNGGSDGGDGGYCIITSEISLNTYFPGKGQGRTTRYFGESTGTLYAGGGGGIAAYRYTVNGRDYKIGGGGAGGGGNALSSGAYGTGGGGGAGGWGSSGGSGICIIRWDDQKS